MKNAYCMNRVVAIVAFVAFAVSVAAAEDLPQVRMNFPPGIRTGFVIVQAGPKAGTKYVVIQDVVIPNSSRTSSGAWKKDDFSLVAFGGARFHPVVRPGYGALDIARDGVIGPRQALKGDLAFIVPTDVTRATLEFLPYQWYDGNGIPMKYCCAAFP